MSVQYPTINETLVAHDSLITKYGGSFGVRDQALLESAVYRCQASFGGEDLYKTLFDKAAAIFHALIFDHPFVDGNKRTAITLAAAFLAKNGYDVIATQAELIAFPLSVEQIRPPISEIARWFKSHCKKRRKRA